MIHRIDISPEAFISSKANTLTKEDWQGVADGLLEEVRTDHVLTVLDLVADDALYLLDVAFGDLRVRILGREFTLGTQIRTEVRLPVVVEVECQRH